MTCEQCVLSSAPASAEHVLYVQPNPAAAVVPASPGSPGVAADSGAGWLGWLFDTSSYPPRWHCGQWSDAVGWLHVSSDLLVWGAYMAIPLVLAYFVSRRKDVPFTGIFWLFCAFIFACGTGHFVEAVIFWEPIYNFSGLVKLATAIVSWATVFALVPAVPRALELPGLAQVNAQLSKEVEERRKAEQEIQSRNHDLEMLLSVISHDLREPLRTIRGFSQLLAERYKDQLDERGRDYLSRMANGASRLDEQLQDMLKLSRARRADHLTEPVELSGVVQQIVARCGEQIKATGARVVVEPGLPCISGDETWVQEALYNLMTNALKFTQPGRPPEVTISPSRLTDSDGQELVGVSVKDRGPGIPPEQAERVFELFRRGVDRGVPGTGAGLAIVRQVALRHGGQVWVQPREGGGSEFVLLLRTANGPEA